MIRIVLFWLLQALWLAGLGRTVQHWWWKRQRVGPAETIWLGLAVAVMFAQLWHFVLPINAACTSVLVIASLPGLWLLWKERHDMTLHHKDLLFWGGLLLLIALIAASHVAVRSIIVSDTRLYHLNVVRWNNEFPVVPGLANLHQRFGVNSTWLLYSSLLDIGWAEGRSAWLVSGLPLMLVMAQWMAIFFLRHGPEHVPAKIYCLLTLPYLLELIEGLRPSLHYDKPPLLLLLVLGLHLLKAPWLRRANEPSTDWRPSALWCLTAAALAFTFKASTATALIFISSALVYQWWRTKGQTTDLVKIWTLPTLLVLGYMLTNVVISGWPLFPLAILGVPVSWAQPREDVVAFHRLIADWAPLQSSEGMTKVREGFWVWWPLWLQLFAKTAEHFMAVLCSIGSACMVWPFMTKPLNRYPWQTWAVFGLSAMGAGGIAFWMITAPDLRFGDGLFYFWFGIWGTLTAPLLIRSSRLQLMGAGVLCLILLSWVRPVLLPWLPFHTINVSRARSDEVIAKQSPGTPTIWTPLDRTLDMLGDSKLPSAPTLDPRLRTRDPNDMGAGFYLAKPETSPVQPK
jgi:hypothetical protein